MIKGKYGNYYFLSNQSNKESSKLKTSIETIGIYILRFGRSITISPGNRPKGIFERYGKSNPITIRTKPMIINTFPTSTFIVKRT